MNKATVREHGKVYVAKIRVSVSNNHSFIICLFLTIGFSFFLFDES